MSDAKHKATFNAWWDSLMPLKDFQSGQMKRTVAEVNEAEREETAQFWRSFRKFVLGYLLGFVTCLLLLG